jgi:hypothetical protein
VIWPVPHRTPLFVPRGAILPSDRIRGGLAKAGHRDPGATRLASELRRRGHKPVPA